MRWAAQIGHDVRQAVRALRAAPAFTLTAVLTLALGIGANTAVFSVVNALLFRPLPVSGGDRLVVLATSKAPSRALHGLSYPEIEDVRAGAGSLLEGIAGYIVGFAGVAPDQGSPARVLVTWVSGEYFSVLGIAPALGRPIDERDVTPGQVSQVAVLGYDAWRTRFNSDPAIVGRRVLLNGHPCTIVGVAPRGFSGAFAFSDPELYLPLNVWSAAVFNDRSARGLHTLARLGTGVSLDDLNPVLDVIARRLEALHPDREAGTRIAAIPERLARPEEDNARTNAFAATIILLLVALVFVGAEVNLLNLLLARGAARRRELAIRAAVGASRGRLVQQLAVETTLLALIGGGAGLLLASWTAAALSTVRLPGNLPVHFDFGLDARVLAYAFALMCLTAVGVGMLAAISTARVEVEAVLRDRRSDGSGRSRSRSLRTMLVIAQTAVCFLLLVAAGLFTRSLREARRMDFGFDPQGVLNVQMDAAQVGYDDERSRALFDDIERRVRRLPGIEDVSYACTVPMGYVRLTTRVGEPAATDADRVSAGLNIVGPRYFHVMGIAITRGRPFDDRDTRSAPHVAIVNAQLADTLWPGEDPIGRRFTDQPDGAPIEVVGVAATSKYRLLFEDPYPYVYLPLTQRDTSLRVLHVRTSSSRPESAAAEIQRVIREREPALPLYDVQSMSDALNGGPGFFLIRTAAMFSLVLGGLAAVLAMVGLYGVLSCGVTERAREIGVRLALGATPAQIARMVVADSAAVAGGGALLGGAAAIAAGRVISRLLFGIAPTDPLSFLAAATCLILVTLVATFAPAARAMTTDPIASLRRE